MNKNLLKLCLASFFIFLFPLLIQIIFAEFVREGEFNTRFGWPLMLMMVAMLHRSKLIYCLSIIPFMLTATADISYVVLFGGVFTTATMEAVMQTDSGEAFEFFVFYSSPLVIVLLSFYWAIAVYLLSQVKLEFNNSKAKKFVFYSGLILTIVVTYRISVMHKYYDTIPGVMGSIPSYFTSNVSLQKEIQQRQTLVDNNQYQIEQLMPLAGKQTYVVVIAESLNRNHMSLYGYHRQTTAELELFNHQLTVFDDVISSHAQTRKSLSLALTEANTNNGKNYRQSLSVVDLANKAGYKTWWISNQQPLRSAFTAFSKQADQQQFISNDFKGVENRRYDGFMLPYIEQALADEADKKVIFVHLMGSHASYANRYPAEFNKFNDEQVKAYRDDVSERQISKINSYDNSVAYTDIVVANVITQLAEQKVAASLILFADHGEEVFDSKDISGHGPDNVTAGMLEIPFLVWMSEQQKHYFNSDVNGKDLLMRITQNTDQPHKLDDLFYTLADFMMLRSDALDLSQSFFAKIDGNQKAVDRKVYKKSYEKDIRL